MCDFIVMAFERDDPFTMDDSCFYNLKTGEVVWVGPAVGGTEEDYKDNPDWLIVPGTPHGEWHDQFLEFLSTIDKLSEYTGSIGRTLKGFTDEQRYSWYGWKNKYAEKKATEWIESINHRFNPSPPPT